MRDMQSPYFEIEEVLTDDVEDVLRIPNTIRIDVADRAEAEAKLNKYKSDFVGKPYTARLITPRHQEKKRCLVEDL